MADEKTWRDDLPEELKVEPMFKDIPDVATLAKVARDLKAFQGTAIRIPGADADAAARKEFLQKLIEKVPEAMVLPDKPEERAIAEKAVWSKLGRPEKAENYSIDGVDVPAGVALDLEAMRAQALKEGLTQAQFKARASQRAAEEGQRLKAAKEAQAALKSEWGAAYEERLSAAASLAEREGAAPETVKAIKEGQAPTGITKMLAALAGKLTGKGNEMGTQGASGGTGKMTPGEALLAMAEIRQRADYWDGSNPRLKERMVELAQFAYREE